MLEEKKTQTAFTSYLSNTEAGIKIEAELPDLTNAEWIPAAKAGQVVDIDNAICSVTAESLESSIGTWKGRKIFKNHETELEGHIILGEKFENPFLSFLLDDFTVSALAKGEGGSIDAIATRVGDNKLLTMSGVGYSILDKGRTPSCTKEAGCGLAGEGTGEEKGGNVNIKGGIIKPNVNLVVDEVGDEGNPDPEESDKKVEDNKKDMAEGKGEKEEVSFSKEQVATIKADAEKAVGDHMTASHKVELNDLAAAHAAEMKTLGETQVAALETQRVDVQKHVEMIEALSTKFALSEEAKKTLMDAKSVEDVYTLLATLKVTKAEPVVAAEGKSETGCGIVLGSEIEGKTPETVKIEQVGDYDPYTGKYVPSFREELK